MADSVDWISRSSDADAANNLLTSWMVPMLFRVGSIVMGLTLVAGGLLYVKQDSLLYFPEIGGIPRRPQDNPRGYRSPEERQLPYESVRITCADGVQIHGWLLFANGLPSNNNANNNNKPTPTIIFFHGNAGNIGLRLPNAMQMLRYLGANVLMVEYRGYGDSDRVAPTEAGLKLDAEAALQFARQRAGSIDPAQIFLFGRSLGGSVAFHLAEYAVTRNIPLAGIMVENTFTSISDMVDKLMPFLTPLKPFVLKIGWDSARIVPLLKSLPILFLAGAKDELVPHEQMMRLVQLAESRQTSTGTNSLVQLHIIPDGTHNESWLQGGPAYWDALRDFMMMAAGAQFSTSSTRNGNQQETTAATTTTSAATTKSSIPIMSSNFVDIAKEAVGLHAGSSNGESSSNNNNNNNNRATKKEL